MAIRDLPINERPREKALRYGFDELSNYELIALIIGSGTKGHSALDIAYDLIYKNNGLSNLINLPYQEFLNVKGIKEISALKLASTFELVKRMTKYDIDESEEITSDFIYRRYRFKLLNYDQEVLGIVVLDKKKNLLKEKIIYKGTKYGINTSIRDIFKELLLVKGAYFYLFHNHPSEEVNPSPQDVIFTAEVIRECSKLGFTMLDHIVIGPDRYYSFKNQTSIKDT